MKNLFCLPILVFLFLSLPAFAGGPFIVTEEGTPVVWGEDPVISYHPEEGGCSIFDNSEMLTKLGSVLATWEDLTEADVGFLQVNDRLTDINGDNYETYIYTGSGTTTNNNTLTDSFNAVAFDNNGDIVAAVAGEANRYLVLGFAAINAYSLSTGIVSDGMAVLNCRCVGTHPIYDTCTSGGATITVSEAELDFTILHEFGHFLNLDHSQVNLDLFDNGIASDDADIPIMFPYSFDTSVGTDPREDDVVALAALYPSDEFLGARCLITGDLLDEAGNPLRCADVQAITDDLSETVAYVSGTSAAAEDNNGDNDTVDDGECNSNCGHFELYLVPGREYTVTVKSIDPSFTGGSGVGPCTNAQLTTIEEENILTISADQCVADQSSDVGDVFTDATGGVTDSGSGSGGSGSSSSSSDSSGDGDPGDQDGNNPVNYGCTLNATQKSGPSPAQTIVSLYAVLFASGFLLLWTSVGCKLNCLYSQKLPHKMLRIKKSRQRGQWSS